MGSKFSGLKSRDAAFQDLKEAHLKEVSYISDNSVVIKGDSLDVLSRTPSNTVSLILTDPPYHSTKKSNITGDKSFQEDINFIQWMSDFGKEWRRVLRPGGTLYLFCSSEMSARLEVELSKFFRPIAHIVWSKPNLPGYDGWKGKMKKESLRSWYPHSERILVFEHGTYGSHEAYRRSPLGEFLREQRLKAGLSMVQLTEIIGAYGKVNRGGAVANWEAGRNIPNREQYAKLVSALEATGKVGLLPSYEDAVRPMFLNKEMTFTDVWDFYSVRPYKGKHPAEKPQDMLTHIIKASSYEGDVVLDCFAGSGSTGVAALNLGRRTVSIEIEDIWVDRIIQNIRIAELGKQNKLNNQPDKILNSKIQPETLFD